MAFSLSDSDLVRFASSNGLSISQVSDFYSPLPVLEKLKTTVDRGTRPAIFRAFDMTLGPLKQKLLHLDFELCGRIRPVAQLRQQ